MAYFAPIHRPTSVKHALKLELLSSEEEESLVLVKANRLEIWTQASEGFALLYTRSIYGKVEMLEKFRPADSATDHLFIGTDRYTYFTVFWDEQTRQLQTKKVFNNQADRSLRKSQTQDRCQIDPTRSFMALLLFDGIVSILPMSQSSKKKVVSGGEDLGEPVPARISDLFVRSSAFLHTRPKDKTQTKLALLYEDNHQRACISVRALDFSVGMSGESGSADLENLLGQRDDLELGASHLIPISAPAYGMLVLCETSICYLSDISAKLVIKSLDQATQFVTWTAVDSQRWLIADEYGKLYFLMLLLDGESQVIDWNLDLIGQTSQASVLVYLDNGLVFVGSHYGDSQIFEIRQEGIELVQTLVQNIAPILDFTIMDMGSRSGEGHTNEYSSGQARLITGSGAFGDGSLRSVRSGVSLEEQGALPDMSHATDLFGLKSKPTSEADDTLVVSFVGETRIFGFHDNGEIEEQTGFKGFSMSEETLLASNLEDGHLLQVTASAAILIDPEDGMVVSRWTPPDTQTITAASSNDTSIALSIGGIEAVTLSINKQLKINATRTFQQEGQIACIHVTPNKDICFAGFWQSATILLLNTTTLETIGKATVSDDTLSVPRSILLAPILAGKDPTLFVAMANGEVITFSLNLERIELSSKKIIILGTQQASFKALPRSDGLSNVFATCDHPSLIYGSDGRIVYSAVNADKATSVCSFNSELYPGAIAIATPEDVKIALVDTERTTNVNTLPIGETVRRIAYSAKLKAFGMGTIHRSLRGTQEIVQSHFKLVDEIVFEILDTWSLNEEELVESVARADIREDFGKFTERFVVGTAFLEDDQGEAIRGRILVFAVTTERKLKLITDQPVKGACRALGCIDGNIVAALDKTVVIYSLSDSHLQKITAYRTSTAPMDLAIHEPTSQICIADLMKSISIVSYRFPSASHPEVTLTETCRHFQTAWSTACAHVDVDTWLEADADGNLIVLKQNTAGVTADDKRRLEIVSEIRLGEMVNRIREVRVEASPKAPVVPKAFMATVDGGVYLFGQIAPMWLDLLMRLQSALADEVVALGKGDFNKYRAYCNEVREAQEPYRFVDGELIEQFLDLPTANQETVMEDLGEVGKIRGGIEGVKELVEGLRRLH